jgi:hypothetical protein
VFVMYTVLLIFAVLVLVVELAAALALIIALARAIPLARHGAEVTGYVTRIEARPRSRTARVRISYETAAGTLETRGSSRRPRLGEPKPVRYDPAVEAADVVRAHAIAGTLTAAVFAAVAVTALFRL